MDISLPSTGFPFIYTALATLFISFVATIVMFKVGKMRQKHGVKAPAVTGADEFNYAFRVQQNTIEQMVMFLPVLWVFALLVSDLYAGIAGGIWVVGRLLYAMAYWKDPAKRSLGFMINFITLSVLTIWSVIAVIGQF